MSQRRILILSKGFPPDLGGIETYSLEVARAYRAQHFDVTVITQFRGTPGWHDIDGCHVLNTGPNNQLRLLIRFTQEIRRLTARQHFDVIHAVTWRTALPAIFARTPAPIAITVHGREVATQRNVMAALCRWVLARATRIVSISNETQRRCATIAPILAEPRTVVSWNGISQIHKIPRPANTKLKVLTSCRLTAMKNVLSVINAAFILKYKDLPPFEFIITGDGDQRAELEHFATKLQISNIRFLGKVPLPELIHHYQTADIFLHPQASLDRGKAFEGFCVAVADAMAYGIATVAGSDGAPAEYITNGITGFTVDGRNPNLIADVVEKLLTNHTLRHRVAEAGSTFAKGHFSWAKHVAPIVAITGSHP